MVSRGRKRKQCDDEAADGDVVSELEVEERPKKSKRSKKLVESTPNIQSPFEQAIGSGKHTEDQEGPRKAKKIKKTMPAQETYSTDTLAERRARKKAVREVPLIEDLPDNHIMELPAQKEEKDKAREMALLSRVPPEVNLNGKSFRNRKVNEIGRAGANTSNGEDDSARVLPPPARQVEEMTGKAQVRSFKAAQNLPAARRARLDGPHDIANETSLPNQVKSSEVAVGSTQSKISALAYQPARWGPSVSGSKMPPSAKDVSQPAPFTNSNIHPARLIMMARDESLRLSNDTTIDSAEHPEGGACSKCVKVESRYVLGIIGKGGSGIRAIARETGAKVFFMKEDREKELYTRCYITGDSTAIAQAQGRIVLAEAALRGSRRAAAEAGRPEEQQLRLASALSPTVSRQQEHRATYCESPPIFQTAEDMVLNSRVLPLIAKPPVPAETLSRPSEKINGPSDLITSGTKSKGSPKSATTWDSQLCRSPPYMQSFPRAMNAVTAEAPARASLPHSTHESESAQEKTLQHQLLERSKSAISLCKPCPVIPTNTNVIKIEDDSDSSVTSKTRLPHTSLSLFRSDRTNTAGITSPSLDVDIRAVLEERKVRIQKRERECRILRYMLDYLGISEMQIELFQQRCNYTRSGRWDDNCRAILGRERTKRE